MVWAGEVQGPASPRTRGHPCWLRSAAVVGSPVVLAALGERGGEHRVLLGHGGMAELGGAAAVGDPGGLAELVEAVVAGGVPDLRVAAGLAGDHAGAERATGVGAAAVVAGRGDTGRGDLGRGDRGGRGLDVGGDRRAARVPRRVGPRAELCGRAWDLGGL